MWLATIADSRASRSSTSGCAPICRTRSRYRCWEQPASPGWRATTTRELRSGDTLKTTLDLPLQRVGQQALQHAIDANYPANGGAFVALDPENGQVYAMGSLPTYNPNVSTRATTGLLQRLNSPSTGAPLMNRAIQSASPIGSTFTPITALAALESGAWSVGATFDDTGQFCFQEQCRHNSGREVDGVLDLQSALKISSNDFFYNLGALTGSARPAGALDAWAGVLGIGRQTGVDLPGESAGTLPTPAWRAQRNRLEAECDAATGPYAGRPKHPPGGCGIADGSNRPWSVGDNESLAAGQGDVQITPLQLAVAYATIANGGTVVTPHLGLDIESANGTVLRQIDPAGKGHLKIDPLYLNSVRAGLRAAVLTARRHIGRRVRKLPRAGLRRDRQRPDQRPAGQRVVRGIRARHRDLKTDRCSRHRGAGRIRRSSRRTRSSTDPLPMVLRPPGSVDRRHLPDHLTRPRVSAEPVHTGQVPCCRSWG